MGHGERQRQHASGLRSAWHRPERVLQHDGCAELLCATGIAAGTADACSSAASAVSSRTARHPAGRTSCAAPGPAVHATATASCSADAVCAAGAATCSATAIATTSAVAFSIAPSHAACGAAVADWASWLVLAVPAVRLPWSVHASRGLVP